jgi:hypothetical protein
LTKLGWASFWEVFSQKSSGHSAGLGDCVFGQSFENEVTKNCGLLFHPSYPSYALHNCDKETG